MTWSIVTTVAPDLTAITAEEAAYQARLDAPTDEPNLELYINSATSSLERYLNEARLITQTVQLTATSVDDLAELPIFPIQSITSIETLDGEDVLASFEEFAGAGQRYASLSLLTTAEWPGAVRITAIVGYGDQPADVPPRFRLALLIAVSTMIDNRGALPAEFFETMGHLLEQDRRLVLV